MVSMTILRDSNSFFYVNLWFYVKWFWMNFPHSFCGQIEFTNKLSYGTIYVDMEEFFFYFKTFDVYYVMKSGFRWGFDRILMGFDWI